MDKQKFSPDFVYNGKTIRQWAIETGYAMATIRTRISRGLPLEGVRCETASSRARKQKARSYWSTTKSCLPRSK